MKATIRLIFLLAVMISSVPCAESQISDFGKIRWEREKIAPGLIWKSSHTIIDDSIPQNINLLIVNCNRRAVSLIYRPDKNVRTSLQASDADAVAAINAGFFNVKDGGSATYIRINGAVVDTDTSAKWRRNQNMTGSVAVMKSGRIVVGERKPNHEYDNSEELRDILVTGPLMLRSGTKVRMPESSLVISRHPRTAAGVRKNGRVVLVTIDGRTSESRGMTLLQLANLMISLKCADAVNLDGGGSTTMWIKGKPFSGVVNMPCDNKKFDHEGERAVSNIIIIK